MRPSSLLGVLLDCLEEFEREDGYPADVRLARFFRERRYLGSKDRRFVGDAAFSWLRHGMRGEIRFQLWSERVQLSPAAEGRLRPLGSLLAIAADGLFPWKASELAEAAAPLVEAFSGWFQVFDLLRQGRFLEESDWPADPLDRLAAESSLPRWTVERLAAARGIEGARRLGLSFLQPAPLDLRVYLSRVERETVRRELEETFRIPVEATPFSPAGLRLRSRINLKGFLKSHPAWAEVQDEGSQLAAMATAAAPGETVIDACAGSGGKTLALLDLLRGEGKIHACDVDARKLRELERRAEPLRFKGLITHPLSAQGALPQNLPKAADLVVADAPCSGLGTLRRNPHLKRRLSEAEVSARARSQGEILDRFAGRVRPGGRLAAITCSILPEENEAVAAKFLESHPAFQKIAPAVAARLPGAAVENQFLYLDPVRTGTDGFFVAVFKNLEPARKD